MLLYDRRWRVQVGTLVLSERARADQDGLATTFKITRSLSSTHAGTCEVRVYNLSREHSAELADAPRRTTFVSVDAGYAEGTSRLFTGNLRKAIPSREGTDWIVTVTAGDGEYARRNARVGRAFSAQTNLAAVVRYLAEAMGVGVGNAVEAFRTARMGGGAGVLEDGTILRGMAAGELTRLCDSAGLTWSIQDGLLQVLPAGASLGRTAIRLGPDSGLIDTPSIIDRRTVEAKALIQPGLVPGQQVVLASALVGGVWRISEVTFNGETDGDRWEAELTLKRPMGNLLDRATPGQTSVDS